MGNEKELKTFHFILSEGGIVHCSRSKRVQHKGSFCPHIDFRPRKIRFIEFDDFLVNDFVKSQGGKDGTNLAIFLGSFSKMGVEGFRMSYLTLITKIQRLIIEFR